MYGHPKLKKNLRKAYNPRRGFRFLVMHKNKTGLIANLVGATVVLSFPLISVIYQVSEVAA